MNQPVEVHVVLEEGATMPRYQTHGSAGMDVCTAEEFELKPMERRLVRTGLRMAIPHGYEVQVRPRSGLAIKHGISMVNTPGTIDSDYRGEIKLILINFGSESVKFQKGERVGQFVLCPVIQAVLKEVAELGETERGEGGFGSTGH